jgi:hypothetical protein
MGDKRAALWSPHCASVARTLKPAHMSRYPRRRIPADPTTRLPPFSRLARANIKTRGATEGTIIATIMTAHITKSRRSSTAPQRCICGMAISGAMSMAPIPSAASMLRATENR